MNESIYLQSNKKMVVMVPFTLRVTNIAGWKAIILNRRYIFIHGGFPSQLCFPLPECIPCCLFQWLVFWGEIYIYTKTRLQTAEAGPRKSMDDMKKILGLPQGGDC